MNIYDYKKTLFEECNFVKIIESMRNEVVHNGSWELNPKVYTKLQNGKVIERFMLFPDISQGCLTKVKSRNHFFGNEKKINNIFPKLHNAYKKRLLNTIKLLNNYPVSY